MSVTPLPTATVLAIADARARWRRISRRLNTASRVQLLSVITALELAEASLEGVPPDPYVGMGPEVREYLGAGPPRVPDEVGL